MEPSQRKKFSSQRRKHRVDGSSQEQTQIPETQIPFQPQPSQNFGFGYQNQTPPQHNFFQYQYPLSQDCPPGFGYQNQNSPQPQMPYYVPDTAHFRDTQPQSSDEIQTTLQDEEVSSDETQPENNQATAARTFTQRVKRKPWSEDEEVALCKAYVQCTEDQERGNQMRATAFWERIRDHFYTQIRGSDRTTHQLNSKWKDLQGKCNKFNAIYNKLKNRPSSGRSDVDLMKAARSEFLKTYKKHFQHEASWDILKMHAKWLTVGLMGTNPPHSSSKRSKTSASNEYTSGSDAGFSAHFTGTPEDVGAASFEREENVSQPEPSRRRKGKKQVSGVQADDPISTLVQQISHLTDTNEKEAEAKERYRINKLAIMEREAEKKAAILEEELRAMKERRFDKDLQFFLQPHEHLTGGQLKAVVARKRQIADLHGWEF